MRSILEAYYEPQFSPNSHGFRPGKGCHTALKDIFIAWKGTRWFIEGDIKGCFDNIDHQVLMSILRERIQDGRFLHLVDQLLQAGYLEQWLYQPSLSGTPQGGIISPLLANIYLDRLDKFVEQNLIPEFTRGTSRKKRTAYNWITTQFKKLKAAGIKGEALKALKAKRKDCEPSEQMDPNYRRLRYIRYADDFLLGLSGPKKEAEEIRARIGTFLRDHLKLELSPEKTLITHASTEQARFLGYEIGTSNFAMRGTIVLRLPVHKLKAKIAKYRRPNGKPLQRTELTHDTDFSIVATYGSEYRGFVQYYAFAQNRFWLKNLRRAMELSMLHTLAGKHRTTLTKIAKKYTTIHLDRDKWLKCYLVVQERPGREPLLARFGGESLSTQPHLKIEDGLTGQDWFRFSRSELLVRLLADTCELCGSNQKVEVHHVRKLADLQIPGRKEGPTWKKVMAARRRKTLIVCEKCHEAIHAGKPTQKSPGHDVF
jgi:group II intron reverse transcriptase/maturase